MFQANALIYFMKTFAVSNIPPLALVQLILYKTPDFLRQTLPIGMALASSLAVSRITRESELTAMRSAGMPIRRLLVPVGLFGLMIGVLNYLITEKVLPVAEKKFSEVSQKVIALGMSAEFKSNVTLQLQSNSTAYFASVQRIKDDKLMIRDAILFEQTKSGEVSVYFSKEGIYDRGILTFDNGDLWRFKEGKLEGYEFKKITIDERISLADMYTTAQSTDKTIDELRVAINDGRKMGRDVTTLEIDYHSRFSVPAACLVFAVTGPVFAIMLGKSGGFVGVFLSMLMVMVYYNGWIISTQILGRNEWISPVVSAWLPNVIFLAFGILGLRRLE
jgi:lipopolysaccharide export LptBFGC system permease protein LptF